MKKKNILLITVIILVILLIIVAFLLFNKSETVESDAKTFASEYTLVGEDNIFVYRSAEEIINILKNGTGIVYLGFPECPWCQAYLPYLNDLAKDLHVEKIYYYNILEDRKNNTKEYQEMVKILSDYLQYDEEGNKRIYVPAIIAVNEGKIVGFDDETSLDTNGLDDPKEYWTDEEVKDLKSKLTGMISKITGGNCTDCNK